MINNVFLVIMTVTKKKFRYACIYLQKDNTFQNDIKLIYINFTKSFYNRLEGLFGSVDFHKSNIKIIKIDSLPSNIVIIKCRLEYIDNVLMAIYFTNSPLLILPVSGTIKQLKKRIHEFLEFKEFLKS
jgi:RNase P/RNase MRP subunit POP5